MGFRDNNWEYWDGIYCDKFIGAIAAVYYGSGLVLRFLCFGL